MTGLDVLTRIAFEAIDEDWMIKRTNMLESQVFKLVESVFEEPLLYSYFNSNNGLKSAMFNVVEPAMDKVNRIGRLPTVSWDEMWSLCCAIGAIHTIFIFHIGIGSVQRYRVK